MSRNRTYDFDKGARVKVYNHTLGGRRFLEGLAVIVALGDLPDQYAVRFIDQADRGTYLRFIVADEQSVA